MSMIWLPEFHDYLILLLVSYIASQHLDACYLPGTGRHIGSGNSTVDREAWQT